MSETKQALQDAENEIVATFDEFEEWLDKYEYIIELGKSLAAFPEEKKTDDRLIKGCQSRVWLDAGVDEEGRMVFSADSDAIITRGLISLLIHLYSGRKPEEILASDFSVIDRIGLRENLSPTRSNGLASMVETLRKTASAALEAEK